MTRHVEVRCDAARLAVVARLAPHLRPIYEVAHHLDVGHAVIGQGGEPFDFSAMAARGPAVYLIGDDTDRALGPDGFDRQSLVRLLRPISHALIFSGATHPFPYSAAAAAAAAGFSVALVETRHEREIEWATLLDELAAPSASIMIVTPGGLLQ